MLEARFVLPQVSNFYSCVYLKERKKKKMRRTHTVQEDAIEPAASGPAVYIQVIDMPVTD